MSTELVSATVQRLRELPDSELFQIYQLAISALQSRFRDLMSIQQEAMANLQKDSEKEQKTAGKKEKKREDKK